MSRVKIAGRAATTYLYVSLVLLLACGRVGVELLDTPSSSGLHGTFDGGPQDGTCSSPCENAHGTADCSGGSCLAMCSLGYADCDGTQTNGCETDTSQSMQNCGSCGRGCTNAHGETSCTGGLCLPLCAAGFADCDNDTVNGCEADLNSVTACGTCARACTNAHGETTCAAGLCSPTCNAGYADCDGDLSNGCEVNLDSDPMHCGGCATVCIPDTQVCVAGQCQLSPCPAGRGECDGNLAVACETDLTSSVGNCGFCGNMCTAAHGSASCAASACTVASCQANYGDCDASASNGCETALASSTAHCGSCGTACTNPNGSVSCVASTCSPICSSGYGDCDASRQNGCETSLNAVDNCGMCGKVCPANGGTPGCSAGICTTTCDLTGAFALKLSISTTWSGSSVLAAGSGTFSWWSLLRVTQSGNSLTGTLVPCGETVPDFASTAIIGENYGLTLPNTIYDGTPLPSTVTSGTLGSSSPGAAFALARSALLVGATMTDPVNDAWPSSGALMQLDADGNGKPGVTCPYKSGGSYDAPPANSIGSSRATSAYLATRTVFTLSGTLDSCTSSTGSATVQDVDYHTIGCWLTSGRDCSAGETSYLDSNGPDYRTGASTYTLIKLSGATTCAAVRAAAP